jgi:AraC-like DNA-binding protein
MRGWGLFTQDLTVSCVCILAVLDVPVLGSDHLVFSTIQVAPGREWNNPLAGWRFLLIRQGSGSYVARSTSHPVGQGDALVLTSSTGGLLQALPPNDLVACLFRFYPEQLIGLLTLAEWRLLETIAIRPDGVRVFPSKSPFARQYHQLACQPSLADGLAQRCVVLQLVAALLAEERQAHPPEASNHLSGGDRVNDFITHLSESQLQGLSVSDLARKCGYSRRHLNRLFHKNFGRSIAGLKMRMRLEKAAALLRASEGKIIDVAMECGFSHLGMFSAKFKERFGANPSEWRRTEQANHRDGKPITLPDPAPERVKAGKPLSTPARNHLARASAA